MAPDLFDRFYAKSESRALASAFDGTDPDLMRKVREVLEDGPQIDRSVDERVTTCLNFFEFVEQLRSRGILTASDVKGLFDWPLRKIAEQDGIDKYFKRYGYEALGKAVTRHRG